MAKLNDGNVNIEITRGKDEVIAKLEAVQYNQSALEHYQNLLAPSCNLLTGIIKNATDELLEISYELPQNALSITQILKNADLLKRLELARKYHNLYQENADRMRFFIHPDNLFLISSELYIAHRGLVNEIEPRTINNDQFLQQYKALVINALNPKYRYEDLVLGTITFKDKTYSKIFNATSMQEIEDLLAEQYFQLNRARELTEQSVKKSKYTTFKILTATLTALLIGAGIWLGLLLENTVPKQERIIDAHAAFLINNFGDATQILSNDEPRSLPTSVQYMLATSHVHLSTLTLAQRQAILNNLSPMSNQNELIYWIYIGRGEILEALNLAYIIGDNQLKLHAYANRYDYITAHPAMPGVERQNALTNYRNRIEELAGLLNERIEQIETPDEPNENYDYNDEGDNDNGDE